MRLRVREIVGFAKTPHELGVSLQNFVEQFAVVNVISSFSLVVAIGRSGRRIHQQLRSVYCLEINIFIDSSLDLLHLNILQQRCLAHVKLSILIEKVLGST